MLSTIRQIIAYVKMNKDQRKKIAALAVGILAHENSKECSLENKGEKVGFDFRAKPVITLRDQPSSSGKLIEDKIPINPIGDVDGSFSKYTINGDGSWGRLEGAVAVNQEVEDRLDFVLMSLAMHFCRLLLQDEFLLKVLTRKRSPTDIHGVDYV